MTIVGGIFAADRTGYVTAATGKEASRTVVICEATALRTTSVSRSRAVPPVGRGGAPTLTTLRGTFRGPATTTHGSTIDHLESLPTPSPALGAEGMRSSRRGREAVTRTTVAYSVVAVGRVSVSSTSLTGGPPTTVTASSLTDDPTV